MLILQLPSIVKTFTLNTCKNYKLDYLYNKKDVNVIFWRQCRCCYFQAVKLFV